MCGTCTHPAGFTGLNAAGYIITWAKWILRPESHRHRLLYERSALLALPRRKETGAPARTCTSTLRLRTATCTTLTPRELKTFASCRCRPGPCGLEDRHARCYINDAGLNKMVAEFGIAPNSPRLQRGANLSQLFSLGKMVPPRGNAPRSIDYQSMALLLSYGGGKSPVKVTLPRLPGVGRACCYYTNGRKMVTASGLSPDRTELRTRVLEMLCICGEMAEHQRIALWTP